jgi:uncharacterized membrane protein
MVTAAWTHARWVVIALLVSLALNLFLLGAMGGRHMRGWVHDSDRPMASWLDEGDDRPLRRLFLHLTQDLDRDDRAAFRATIELQRESLVEQGMALLDQRRAVLELLRAEPFDRAAVDAALAELGRRHDAFHQLLMKAIADAAQALPPEARARLGGGWE